MKTTIIGRKCTPKDAFKLHAEKKLAKIEKFFSDEAEAKITVTVEKPEQIVELTIKNKGMLFRAEETAKDMEDEVFFGRPQNQEKPQPQPYRGTAPMPGPGCGNAAGCLALALVLALAAAAFIYMHQPAARLTVCKESLAPKVCSKLRSSGKMEFYKEQVKEMGVYKRIIGGLNTASLEILYFGTMQYGCDLSRISERDIEIDTALNTITIHLPQCQLLCNDIIDEELTRKYYDNSWINFDPAETEKCKADAYSKMMEKYPEHGIRTAESMGKDIISGLVEKSGFSGGIYVKFDI